MISKKLQQELNTQINKEFFSAYTYAGAAIWCTAKNYLGAAHWFKKQAEEEVSHAEKIINYLLDREIIPQLENVKAPTKRYNSLLDVFNHALKQERDLLTRFETLAKQALKENDNTTYTFLQWFLTEQVEEVNSCLEVIDKLKLVGKDGTGILLIDSELGKRE
ncbi:MAG: ferritin [Candidatus Dadabacteria bacterium]|nr:MAG: ferritin [Candidatus Dadabacteria bacterium]